MSAPKLPIPLALPTLGDEEIAALGEVVRSGWVTQGPQVAAFEAALAARVGARHAVATSSGTTALHLALVAAGIGPGDEVLVPTLSFIASANAVRHAGAAPVLVDVDPHTFNLTVATCERALTARSRALVAVHQIGLPCDLDPLAEFARSHKLALIEDAACAVGATYRGRAIGRPAQPDSTVCFSFHPRKVMTTGEGGMILTEDHEGAERLRRLRHHGMAVSDVVRHGAGRLVDDRFDEVGWNYRMSDLQAAVGLVQLQRLDGMLARRRTMARRYDAAFAGTRVVPPRVPDDRTHTYQSYQVLLEESVDRDAIAEKLLAQQISVRRGLMLIHRQPPYAEARGPFPGAEAVAGHSLMLPLFDALRETQVDYVIDRLICAIA